MNLALVLFPLIPGLITDVMKIIDAIKNHPDTPQDVRTQLEVLTDKLDETAKLVDALELRNP